MKLFAAYAFDQLTTGAGNAIGKKQLTRIIPSKIKNLSTSRVSYFNQVSCDSVFSMKITMQNMSSGQSFSGIAPAAFPTNVVTACILKVVCKKIGNFLVASGINNKLRNILGHYKPEPLVLVRSQHYTNKASEQ